MRGCPIYTRSCVELSSLYTITYHVKGTASVCQGVRWHSSCDGVCRSHVPSSPFLPGNSTFPGRCAERSVAVAQVGRASAERRNTRRRQGPDRRQRHAEQCQATPVPALRQRTARSGSIATAHARCRWGTPSWLRQRPESQPPRTARDRWDCHPRRVVSAALTDLVGRRSPEPRRAGWCFPGW